jgi:OOP family OmpA-OmpF porin
MVYNCVALGLLALSPLNFNLISRYKGTLMFNKKLLVCAIFAGMAVSTAASAACPGFYVGGQLGYSNVQIKSSDVAGITSANVKKDGLGGRLLAGYQFDENWAAELGYTEYAKVKLTNVVPTSVGNASFRVNATDLVLKGMMPLDNGFGLYAKAGAAYIVSDPSSNINTGGNSVKKTRPTAGLGASYDFNSNVVGDISWARVFSGSGVKNSDLAAVGLAYHFG